MTGESRLLEIMSMNIIKPLIIQHLLFAMYYAKFLIHMVTSILQTKCDEHYCYFTITEDGLYSDTHMSSGRASLV